jgi:crotonobetainyl-CoA:carnitine CoA-transferase CaiB-like acyl-CoA transferase
MSVPQKSFDHGAACPLDGLRVIDMSRLVSGNMISLQLADFVAEVNISRRSPTRRTNGTTS